MTENDYAVPFTKWLELAKQKDLLLTPESYSQLVEGKKYEMVEVDFLRFLYLEHGKKYKKDKVYEPQTVYYYLKHSITPTKIVKKNTVGTCDVCQKSFVEKLSVTEYGIVCPDLKWDFYTNGNDKWLQTGNGDSWTRWMLWEDLKKMPNLYYNCAKTLK